MKLRWDSRIAAEVVLVFIGILAAFALDSWWSELDLREREIAILKDMQKEFAATAEYLEQLIAYHENSAKDFEELHHLLETGEGAAASERVIELSYGLWTARVYDANMAAYQSLLESAGLDFIRDEEFRHALIEYKYAADRNLGWDRFLIGFDQGTGLSTLMSRVPYFDAIFESDRSGGELIPDIDKLASDLEFRNLIALRTSGERDLIQLRKQLLEAVREVQRTILAEIEA